MLALVSLLKHETLVIKSSYYFNTEDTTVRISNHLPKRCNWEANENKERKVFVFINEYGNLNDTMIEKYLDAEFDGNYDAVFLFENESEAIESIERIKSQL